MQCLIIDDEFLPRGGTIKTLLALRPDSMTFEAESLSQAFDRLTKSPDIGLIVLDLNLVESRGVQTLKTLRDWCDEKDLSPRIVVLSGAGEDDPDVVVGVLNNYGTGYIPKDGTSESIFKSALSLTLAGGIFIPEEVLRRLRMVTTQPDGSSSATAGRRGDDLTPREREVASLLVLGWTYKRIANELGKRQGKGISENTVRVHVNNIAWKLGVDDSLPPKSGVIARIAALKIKFSNA